MNTSRMLDDFFLAALGGAKVAKKKMEEILWMTFVVILIFSAVGFVGIILNIQLLTILATTVLASISLAYFFVVRFVNKFLRILSPIVQFLGTLSIWFFFLGFLNAIHPEWFSFNSENIQNLMVFGTAGLFIIGFFVYSGIYFAVINVIMAIAVMIMTIVYALNLSANGLQFKAEVPGEFTRKLDWYLSNKTNAYDLSTGISLRSSSWLFQGPIYAKVMLDRIIFEDPYLFLVHSYENMSDSKCQIDLGKTFLLDINKVSHPSVGTIFLSGSNSYWSKIKLMSGERKYFASVFKYLSPEMLRQSVCIDNSAISCEGLTWSGGINISFEVITEMELAKIKAEEDNEKRAQESLEESSGIGIRAGPANNLRRE